MEKQLLDAITTSKQNLILPSALWISFVCFERVPLRISQGCHMPSIQECYVLLTGELQMA